MSEKSVENKFTLDESERDALRELLNTFKLVQNFLNDQVMQDLVKNLLPLARLLNALAGTDLIDVLERALQDPELDKELLDPTKVGMLRIPFTLSKTDTKYGMGIMMALVKAMGRASSELSHDYTEMEEISPSH